MVLVTLLSVYLACWRVTQSHGIRDVQSILGRRVGKVGSPVPFLVSIQERVFYDMQMRRVIGINREVAYYVWFFGYVAKLPYEREI